MLPITSNYLEQNDAGLHFPLFNTCREHRCTAMLYTPPNKRNVAVHVFGGGEQTTWNECKFERKY